ncbi:myeloid protein 1-like [Mauremys reevesii]|uniref:myeloid protein 1-like n=1 Tax=Mauremys reevesii TaxID=260615 RepID=UPI00193F4B82|nr:myeloid protein 1-like [Mauremys reevesii]
MSCVAAGPWGQICAGNPRNKARGCDGYGCGYYTAPRKDGRRKHLGVDVICRDGSTVYAPFSGMIERRINPHGGRNFINKGVKLRGSGFCVHMFYIRPVTYRGRIKKGQKIGEMLPMQRVYPGITSHVHVQNCNHFNVTRYLKICFTFVYSISFQVAAGPWGQICAGNPRNKIRGCDRLGCGYYKARRGNRLHLGVDVICRDGSTVYAPFSGVIGGRVNPYKAGKNAINNGILLRGSGFCIHMFYIKPVRYSGRINKGQKIGVMLPMQRVYPGITSHVHVQNCDRSNPTGNL